MSQSDPAAELRAHFRARREASGEHPAPEELVAYRGGTLEAEREGAVRAHLVGCEECAALLLDFAALETSRGAMGDASQIEVEAAWREQRRRLSAGRRRNAWQHAGWAVAAALAAVVGGLLFEVRDLRRQKAVVFDSDLPRVIAEERGVRSSEVDLPVLELTSELPGIVLLLLQEDAAFSAYRAAFHDRGGRLLWARDGLSAAENLLLVQVPPDLLPAGVVRVVVAGEAGDRHEIVEEYALRIRYR